MIYMDKKTLIAINDNAIRKNRNRTLIPEKVVELEDVLFPGGVQHGPQRPRDQVPVGAEH